MTWFRPTRSYVLIWALVAPWLCPIGQSVWGQADEVLDEPLDTTATDPFGLATEGAAAAPGTEPPPTQEELQRQFQEAGAEGERLMGEQKWREALEQFNKMLALSPYNSAPIHLQRGLCLRALGAQNEAIDAFTRAVSQPTSMQFPVIVANAYLQRGEVYLEIARYREAIDDFEQVVSLDSSNVQGLYLLGKARLRLVATSAGQGRDETGQRDLNSALASLKQAIDLKSDFGEAYLERGRVLMRLRQMDFAIEDLQRAQGLLGSESAASAELGSAFVQRANQESYKPQGSSETIVSDLRAGLKSLNDFLRQSRLGQKTPPWETRDPLENRAEEMLLLRAQTLNILANETSGDDRNSLYQAAIKDCQILLDSDPDLLTEAPAYLYKAQALRMLDDLPGAIEAYTRMIQSFPGQTLLQYFGSDPFLRRGICYFHQGEYRKALQDFEAASSSLSNPFLPEPRAMFWAGLAHAQLGELEGAIRSYTRAIRGSPDYVNAYLNRGLAYLNVGRYDQAIEDFNEVLRRKADHTQAQQYRQLAEQRLQPAGG